MAITLEKTFRIDAASPMGFDDAVREAVARASAGLEGVEEIRVTGVRVLTDEGGGVTGYAVDAEVTFGLEDDETPGADEPAGPLPLPADQERGQAPGVLRLDEGGTARVGGTRVTLDSVVAAYRQGESAEGIAARFPSLGLDAVYSVLAWCLRHRPWVDAYLARREEEASRLRARAERAAASAPAGLKERLLARRGGLR
jgi:uncharacterized protein (DUF433 family)/flavin-binding protein dodecin